jgi:hypothetical protein
MKKIALLFVLFAIVAVILLVCSSPGGISLGSVSMGGSEDKRIIEKKTWDFLEDIRYKDFKKAATYHAKAEQKTVDIPGLIERLFVCKPEFLDILRYDIKSVDLDTSGLRARAHVHTVVKILNTSEIKEPEVIFYWMKDPKEGWVMKLESSLR